MKKFIITFIIAIVILSSLVYVDYFNTKTNNTFPKLALKSENDDAVIYTAVMYRVWFCKANRRYMIGSYNEDSICPKNYKYVNGMYKNSNGVNISKKDLQLLTNDGVYTSEMIESMTDDKQVEEATNVAFSYLKYIYKVVNETETNKIIVFPVFKEEDGNYKWIYEEDEDKYYCLSEDEKSYARYSNDTCGKFEKFKMDEKWCESYKNSTLVYDDNAQQYCEK